MSAESELRAANYSLAHRKCDIVMKGGITSGVVYPYAVCELAQTYRFQSVGGTSAGAIAAAATAAAEHGRGKGGFNKLAELPKWLREGTNLRDLFQPQPETSRLFAVLLAGIDRGSRAAIWTAVRGHKPATVAGALPALLLGLAMWAGAIGSDSTFLVIVAGVLSIAVVVLAVLGIALAVGARIGLEANRKIADNGFGLCAGSATSEGGPEALTPWLTGLLNDLSGCSPSQPLTFGHLWAGPEGNREEPPAEAGDRCQQLAMMTTNLVNRTAHQLPWEARDWFFKPEEMRRLFPPEVCAWMETHSPDKLPFEDTKECRRSRMRLALARRQGLLALPVPADLPVVVAARMSLSFPVLLSAVPLWKFDMTRERSKTLAEWQKWAVERPGFDPLSAIEAWPSEDCPAMEPEAECCWFSDGGISSNFPVHFFDRLIPRWPTFALNLRPFPFEQKRNPKDERENTWMVKKNNDGWKEWWYRFPERAPSARKDRRLKGFFEGIAKTMQNRADEAQMRVPGYRDRVAHVSMEDGEGGMNLTMDEDEITSLGERGRAAAQRLVEAYTSDDDDRVITWDNHRWARLRSSLCVLEEMHRRFVGGFDAAPENGGRSYLELVERDGDDPPKSYAWTGPGQRETAKDEIDAIRQAAERGGAAGTTARSPDPAPIGKIVPRE
jgi:predicted acylesterase/phospholipase RssA